MQTQIFHADDITCGHCEFTIRKALSRLEGVVKVKVDIPSKTVEVETHGMVSAARLLAAFMEVGYPATAVGKSLGDSQSAVRDCCKTNRNGNHGENHPGKGKNEGACHV